MSSPKSIILEDGRAMHYSVGALVERNSNNSIEYFLIDRGTWPYGYAGVAGHVDEGERPENALMREVSEEVGMTVSGYELIREGMLDWNKCNKGVGVHYWYLYRCKVDGPVKLSKREAKSFGWYDVDEIRELELEEVWKYWFEDLGIL